MEGHGTTHSVFCDAANLFRRGQGIESLGKAAILHLATGAAYPRKNVIFDDVLHRDTYKPLIDDKGKTWAPNDPEVHISPVNY